MLSIVIPTYNYNAFPLAKVLSEEVFLLKLPIEIIVLDDGSTNFFTENEAIETLPNTVFIKLNKNSGRAAARQRLAEEARYSKVLFLDADVLPVHTDFVEKYVAHIDKKGIIFGGITYTPERPKAEEILRWVYGHKREKQSVTQRNQALYSSITTGCFLLEKETFLQINSGIKLKTYGEDLLFKQRLEEQKIAVLHIDNPVYHLGLETNEQFLKKSLEAVKTTVLLEEESALPKDSRKIQKMYLRLKKFGLLSVFQTFFNAFQSKVKSNLLSPKPNIRGLDLYRLNYYIQLKHKKSA